MLDFFEDKNNHKYFERDMIYHYTNMNTAMEYILADERLRFSSFRKVNDPYEKGIRSLGYTYSGYDESNKVKSHGMRLNIIDDLEMMNTIRLDESKLLCFSQNDDNIRLSGSPLIDIKKYYRTGFFKPRMWAQYGDENQGICIAISREKLANELKKTYPNFVLYRSQVSYSDSIEKIRMAHKLKINPNNMTNFREYYINKHIKEYRNEIFFSKNADWRDEKEYRYLLITDANENDYFINISSSITAVFCGIEFHNVYMESLLQITKNLDIDVFKLSLDDGLPSADRIR